MFYMQMASDEEARREINDVLVNKIAFDELTKNAYKPISS